jgi:hypothetical protein
MQTGISKNFKPRFKSILETELVILYGPLFPTIQNVLEHKLLKLEQQTPVENMPTTTTT